MVQLGRPAGFSHRVHRTGLVPQPVGSVSINTVITFRRRNPAIIKNLNISWYSSPVTEFERFLCESNEQVYYELYNINYN